MYSFYSSCFVSCPVTPQTHCGFISTGHTLLLEVHLDLNWRSLAAFNSKKLDKSGESEKRHSQII